ncbi:MAG: FABP family protein [Ferrimicrobium sp.]|uniref:FABP family protein n=2 Tax=Ferrimicrobium sp. TaxID=2926050 RepID=UPI002631E4A9|nr:FABP family protein [Ferrimicrobium sp.]
MRSTFRRAMEFRSVMIGRWSGEGSGWYPTIADFDYHETVEVADLGRPFLTYRQMTKASDGSPLHTEVGYLRFVGERQAELVVAQPTGISEVLTGWIEDRAGGYRLALDSTQVGHTPTSKPVAATRRIFLLEGDVLDVEFWMEAVGQPMQQHLRSRLRRNP